jgi:hypothetical protein
MDQLQPAQIAQFTKRFQFRGGTLLRFQIRNRPKGQSDGLIVVSARDESAGSRVRLRLRLEGVEEFRFQRRPGPGLVRLKEVRLGYFNGLLYINLDAFAVDGPAALIDFRASDAFAAARRITWDAVPPKPPPSEGTPP